jgi:hypothetical protein
MFQLLLALVGCPESPDQVTMSPEGPGGPGQPGQPGGPGQDPGGQPAGEGGPQPGAAGDAANPGMGAVPEPPGELPKLSDLVKDGQSVKVTINIKGAPKATVDFVVKSKEGGPQLIAQAPVEKASETLDGPATYDGEVWVSGFYDAKGDGPTPDDNVGFAAAAVKFEGKDLTIDLDLTAKGEPPKGSPFAAMNGADAAPPMGGAGGAPGAGGGAPSADGVAAGGAPGGSPPPGGAGAGGPATAPGAPPAGKDAKAPSEEPP